MLFRYENLFTVNVNELMSVCVSVIASGRRYLFSAEFLGIENYKRARMETAERFGCTKGLCCEHWSNVCQLLQTFNL